VAGKEAGLLPGGAGDVVEDVDPEGAAGEAECEDVGFGEVVVVEDESEDFGGECHEQRVLLFWHNLIGLYGIDRWHSLNEESPCVPATLGIHEGVWIELLRRPTPYPYSPFFGMG
jgi:hypothetical protein